MADNERDDIPDGEVLEEPQEKDRKEVILLGQLLIREDLITPEQLDLALIKQREIWQEGQNIFLGQVLIEMGAIEEYVLIQSLIKQIHLPYFDLLLYQIDPEVLNMIPKEICQEHGILPLDKLGRILTVGMCNPFDKTVLDIISQLYPDLHIKRIVCAWRQFKVVFDKHFGQVEPGEAVWEDPFKKH